MKRPKAKPHDPLALTPELFLKLLAEGRAMRLELEKKLRAMETPDAEAIHVRAR